MTFRLDCMIHEDTPIGQLADDNSLGSWHQLYKSCNQELPFQRSRLDTPERLESSQLSHGGAEAISVWVSVGWYSQY
jgi:hypothetical protein